jgi:predicted oxidoreductase
VNRDGSILDFCRLNDITISPGRPSSTVLRGRVPRKRKFPQLNAKIDEIAASYGVSATTIAMAWLLRHPAGMQPVTGT